MRVYLAVTADKYELPLAIADSADELGQILGRSRNDIWVTISRKNVSVGKINGHHYRIIRVDIDEEDEDDDDG